jgi:hypothetical protein
MLGIELADCVLRGGHGQPEPEGRESMQKFIDSTIKPFFIITGIGTPAYVGELTMSVGSGY